MSVNAVAPNTVTQPKIVVKNLPDAPKSKKRTTKVRLTRYEVSVVVDGALCKVSATMTFHNPFSRILEGEVAFPLPPDVAISGYALDVNGSLVDAVPVTKEKARVTLEKEERRRVDPGIVENVQGNEFRTRVYPLPANGSRILRVDYVVPLDFAPDRDAYVCALPIYFDEPVDFFSLNTIVLSDSRSIEPSSNRSNDWEESEFAYSSKIGGWTSRVEKKNFQPTKTTIVSLPSAYVKETSIAKTERGVFALIPIVSKSASKRAKKTASNKSTVLETIDVVWDASRSREKIASPWGKEGALLEALLKRLGVKNVRVIPLRDQIVASEIRTFKAKDESLGTLARQVVEYVEKIPYDGATRLSAFWAEQKHNVPTLLFSDGLDDWLTSDAPIDAVSSVFVFSSGTKTNAATLRKIARASGGVYVDLNRAAIQDCLELVASRLANPDDELVATAQNIELGSDSFDSAVKSEIRYAVGRIIDETQNATITVKRGGKTVLSLVLKPDQWKKEPVSSRGSAIVQTFFAQTRLSELLNESKPSEQQITKLGIDYSLVTPYTSLIVLESLSQYLEHRICPPESAPEMRRQYLQRVVEQKKSPEIKRLERKERALSMWRERLSWYASDFSAKKLDDKPSSNDGDSSLMDRTRRVFSSLADSGRPRRLRRTVNPYREDSDFTSTARLTEPLSLDRPVSSEVFESEELLAQDFLASPALYRSIDHEAEADPSRNTSPSSSLSRSKIVLQTWSHDCPIESELEKASPDARYQIYLESRENYENSPTFYLVSADFFHKSGEREFALRILSNLAEAEWDDQQLLRLLARRLLVYGAYDAAIFVFERIVDVRPEEPQSYRDLALALEERADATLENDRESAVCDYERALELLELVVFGREYNDWDRRFPEIEVIAIEDANGIVAKLKALGQTNPSFDRDFITNFELDLRITLTWTADNTDFDLWVFEPDGTKVYYGNDRSAIGGLISRDYREGYGPEEYLIRNAKQGKYRVEADFFASTAVKTLGEIFVEAIVYTNFGRPNAKREKLTLPLREVKEHIELGNALFKR